MYTKLGSIILTVLLSTLFYLGIENYRLNSIIRELQKEIDFLSSLRYKIDQEHKLIKRPLPVCGKNELHDACRPLTADESGATVRGVRDENQND